MSPYKKHSFKTARVSLKTRLECMYLVDLKLGGIGFFLLHRYTTNNYVFSDDQTRFKNHQLPTIYNVDKSSNNFSFALNNFIWWTIYQHLGTTLPCLMRILWHPFIGRLRNSLFKRKIRNKKMRQSRLKKKLCSCKRKMWGLILIEGISLYREESRDCQPFKLIMSLLPLKNKIMRIQPKIQISPNWKTNADLNQRE